MAMFAHQMAMLTKQIAMLPQQMAMLTKQIVMLPQQMAMLTNHLVMLAHHMRVFKKLCHEKWAKRITRSSLRIRWH